MYSVCIDGWKQNIRFSSAHLLPGHKRCGVLHGHTYAIHTWIMGKQNDQGYVIDFAVLKSHLRSIAESLDHKILIPKNDEHVTMNTSEVKIKIESKIYLFPRDDCVVLPLSSITAEHLAAYILESVLKKLDLPGNVQEIAVEIEEGFGQKARVQRTVG